MKMLGKFAFAGIAAMLCAVPALAQNAEWGWTTWGMKPAEVAAASSGTVQEVPDEKDTRVFKLHNLAEGSETIDGVAYETKFYFDGKTKALKAIDLVPDRSECAAMETAMLAGGEPVRTDRSDVEIVKGKPPVLLRVLEWDRADGGMSRLMNISGDGIGTLFCKTLIMAPGVG